MHGFRGLGFLGLLIPFLSALFTQMAVGHEFYAAHEWIKSMGLVIGGVLVAIVGALLNGQMSLNGPSSATAYPGASPVKRARTSTDRHICFFVPLQYFSVVIFAAALFLHFDSQGKSVVSVTNGKDRPASSAAAPKP